MADVTDGACTVPPLSMLEVLRYKVILATLPQLRTLKDPRKCG